MQTLWGTQVLKVVKFVNASSCRRYTSVRATKVSEIQQDMCQVMGNHEAQQNIPVFAVTFMVGSISLHQMGAAFAVILDGVSLCV